ncbi:MAG TPA: hypothetical protein VLW54_06520 [Candidatus Acidoferrales bacterium]|nr:hypothetical protein [Candidatus Acidoferrales bacterium]
MLPSCWHPARSERRSFRRAGNAGPGNGASAAEANRIFVFFRAVVLVLAALAVAFPASAGVLTGTVHNGTTGKPVAHQTVVLLSPMAGMQEITAVDTDAQGRFQFNAPEIGQGPLLLRVPYEKVNYHQAATPASSSVDVTVYEATAPSSAVHLTTRTIIFQPNGPQLLVGEEFVLSNNTNPPVTYANVKGTFQFALPEGAKLGAVNVTAPGGLPTQQGTIDVSKNRYAIDYALKPGDTNVRVTYELPYEGDRASVRPVSVQPAARIMIAAPVGVQISGDGFSPAGTEQGFTVLTRDNLSAGASFGVTLSGAARLSDQPPSGGGQSAPPSGGGAAPAGENVQVISPRLSSFQWILLGGMGLFFLAGFYFLLRQPHPLPATPSGNAAALPPPVAPLQKPPRRESSSRPAAAPRPVPGDADPDIIARSPSHNAAATVLQQAEQGAQMNLETLKDTLFRLELRRQAGTISDDEYARERSRIEAFLRDLVRG